MFAFQTSRSNARRLSSEFPIGDPFAGPAYGEKTDVGSVVASVAPAVVGGLFGNSAANQQTAATQQAASISGAASQAATDLQRQIFLQQQANQAPWLNTGAGALNQLAYMMGIPQSGGIPQSNPYAQYSGMNQQQIINALTPQSTAPAGPRAIGDIINNPTTANAPAPYAQAGQIYQALQSQGTPQQQTTPQGQAGSLMQNFGMADFQADPGYAFRMSEGMKALENSAAARGGLLSGNMLRGAQDYGQNIASNEYQNAFNRYQTNQGNQFNRLASLAGVGQTANTALGQAGQNYATSAGNIGMSNAANQANAALMAGNARASSMNSMGQNIGGMIGGMFGGSGGGSWGSSPFNPFGGITM